MTLYANAQNYKNRAQNLHLSTKHYWHLLLHMNKGVSEIDDPHFFFAKDGAQNAKAELEATLEAIYSKEIKDDNSSICRFPARVRWLKEELDLQDIPEADCGEYEKIFQRVDPLSTTFVFPSAHINSPASIFGHTFLRINSSYHSKLLSYAINYAADANSETENGLIFAIKGLVGGYYGHYSLLPYYEKLKEYRDGEQRDVWEYDLNLSQEETVRMFEHIWELNKSYSNYYFFTENCSYNMLWLLEIARPSLYLRDRFTFHVAPLETIFEAQKQNLIESRAYRASKRTILLKYEALLYSEYRDYPIQIVDENATLVALLDNKDISLEQKKYILEASIEYLEYRFIKARVAKQRYLTLFHQLTKERAKLGVAAPLQITTPPNPLSGHRATRLQLGFGSKGGVETLYLGVRSVMHDLEDSGVGFLRGTQIEFMNLLISKNRYETKLEEVTLISIVSLAQRSEFFKSFSWRTKTGFDTNSYSEKTSFIASVGAGYSWGNELAYVYLLLDPLVYVNTKVNAAIGGSIGLTVDKYNFMNTNIEMTYRVYDNGFKQNIIFASQGIRLSQNTQIVLKYDYKEKKRENKELKEESFRAVFKYYF